MKMSMMPFSFSGRKRYTPAGSTWIVRPDPQEAADFPSNERVAELWRQTVPGKGELVVVQDWGKDVKSNIGVRIPKGITPLKRQRFLDALGREMDVVNEAA